MGKKGKLNEAEKVEHASELDSQQKVEAESAQKIKK